MSITQTYIFNSPTSFNVNNVLIDGSGAKLALINDTSLLFTQLFTSSSGFTYDAAKAQFSGGAVQQKIQTLNPPSFANSFGVTIVGGTITKTLAGNTFDSGCKSVETIASGNGYVEFVVPLTNKNMLAGLANSQPDHGIASLNFAFFIQSTGILGVYESNVSKGDFGTYAAGDTLRVECIGTTVVYKKNGTIIYTSLTAMTYPMFFSVSFGSTLAQLTNVQMLNTTPYVTSEVDLPVFTYANVGSIRSLSTFTVIESGSPRYILNGKYWNGSAWSTSDLSYSQASPASTISLNIGSLVVLASTSLNVSIIFPTGTIQASVDSLIVGYIGQKYALDGWAEPSMAAQAQDLLNYSDIRSVTSMVNDIKVVVKDDGTFKWWNGTAWATSDGSYSQSNTPAELAANLITLDLGQNSSVVLRWNFNTTNTQLTPTLSEATLEYDFGAVDIPVPTCLIYGYVKDISGDAVAGAVLEFQLINANVNDYNEAGQSVLMPLKVSVTTNGAGYFSKKLVWSSELDPNSTYTVSITKEKTVVNKLNSVAIVFSVPDSDMQDITDLIN